MKNSTSGMASNRASMSAGSTRMRQAYPSRRFVCAFTPTGPCINAGGATVWGLPPTRSRRSSMAASQPTGKRAPATTSADRDSRGQGDELHQRAGGAPPVLSSNQGIPAADNQNTLRQGPRGPTLLEDFLLREKITRFDHERMPERIVHARGSAAHGFFELTRTLGKV